MNLNRYRPHLALGVVILLVYFRAIQFGSLSVDDDVHIFKNIHFLKGRVLELWKAPYYGLYIPVTYSVWYFLYQLSSGPEIFHLFNLILHIANTLLVLEIVTAALGRSAQKVSVFLAAMVFALHPLQVESVAWISCGRELLCTFFGLVFLYLSIQRQGQGSRWPSRVALVLAHLAKPSAVVFPLSGLLLRPPKNLRQALEEFFPLALVSIVTLLVTYYVQDRIGVSVPWMDRPLIALDALGFYLKKTIWPFGLSFDYGRTPLRVVQEHLWFLTVPFGMALIGFCLWVRTQVASRVVLGYLISFLPVLGFVSFAFQEVSTVADRYAYLSLFWVSLGLAVLMQKLGRFSRLAVGALVLAFGFVTYGQLEVWSGDQTLYSHVLSLNPSSYTAHNNLGLIALGKNEFKLAEEHFKSALGLKARDATPFANLGIVLLLQNRFDEARKLLASPLADQAFVDANAKTEGLARMFSDLGYLEGKASNPKAAMRAYCLALEHNPSDEMSYRGFIETQKMVPGMESARCVRGVWVER